MSTTTKRRAPVRPAPRTLQRLPRGGRHLLPQQVVMDSQRERMLLAVVSAVADKGYARTTVADVIERAGVSRRTFYEHFDQVEPCFMAAYDQGVAQLFAAIREALQEAPGGDWRSRARVAIEAYLRAMALAPPGAAWAYSFEVMGAGRQALARRAAVLSQWVAQWQALEAVRQRSEPARRPPDESTLLGLVAGVEELVRQCLLRRGAKHLPSLADQATALCLRILA